MQSIGVKMKYEPGDFYVAKINKHNLFDGVVKILERHNKIFDIDDSDDSAICEIVTVFKTNNDVWEPGWSFYLTSNELIKKVTPDEHPEYFI